MLIIRRRLGEAIVIGTDVQVVIVEMTLSHVALGIEAPKSIPIIRKELERPKRQEP